MLARIIDSVEQNLGNLEMAVLERNMQRQMPSLGRKARLEGKTTSTIGGTALGIDKKCSKAF